jgi:threonine dehydrogenase-like Zn-dependent dehydrogenase
VLIFGAQKIQSIPYETCRKKGVELVYPEAMVNSNVDVDYWNAALDLIAGKDGKKLELQDLITNRISLQEAVKAFEFYDREKWIKILVEPFGE